LSIIQSLQTWEYKLPAGFTVRGLHSKPSGKPVIHFIHGTGFCGLTFEVLLSYLVDDYDLFISDGQGHGESDSGKHYPGWNKSAGNFARAWRHFSPLFGDAPKIAMGHSYGAVISTLMIAKDANMFDAGVLLDPVYCSPKIATTMSFMSHAGLMKNSQMAKQARVRSEEWASEKDAWDYFYQRGTFKGWEDRCLQSYIDHALAKQEDGRLLLKCPARIEAAVFSKYVNRLWSSIKTVKRPMTMLYGKDTYSFVLKALPQIKKKNKNYDFIEMPGGHCFMQQHPKLTAEKIKNSLEVQLSKM